MGNFNKRYIIREAESILEECNRKIHDYNDKTKIINLKIKNKRLKRKNLFWKLCTAISFALFIVAIL